MAIERIASRRGAQIIPFQRKVDRPLTELDACVLDVKRACGELFNSVPSTAAALELAQRIIELKARKS